ncbi:aminotransferase class IV [Propioniciclava sp. MC1683]|uniref:aminotransferase class IV n=1 Tax=Propioniciclava sp. MC1683 TaxID=2760309 RepID=UPI001C71A50B|nr:aminotransferase class IV [Propioniciclava sp. MC1683]
MGVQRGHPHRAGRPRRGHRLVRTGGGITYDSTPAGEYAEALLKAEVLHRPPLDVGLLETLLWRPDSGFPLLERHLARLAASARFFGTPLDPDAVRTALLAAVADRAGPSRVRLVVDADGKADVTVADVPPAPRGPVRVAIDTVPVASHDVFARHKTTQRSVYEAAAARHPGADDVVLVNERGEVTETTIATLAARVEGRWVTPPLSSGCLPGVARAEALASGRLVEGALTPDDLRRATALGRLNAVRGWEEVVLVS